MVMLLLSLLFSNAAVASDTVENAGNILQVMLLPLDLRSTHYIPILQQPLPVRKNH